MTPVKLIRDYFPDVTVTELKALTAADREQLADLIAKDRGLIKDDSGALVEYKAAA